VAGWLVDRGLPGIFRVHPSPGPTLPRARGVLRRVRLPPGFGSALTPLDLAALSAQLDAAADDTAERRCGTCCSASSAARRTRPSRRHFGLASDGYLHFTSPIRRYADLVVHRVVHAFLAGERDVDAYPEAGTLAELCTHIDAAARTSSTAERQMRKALWLVTLAEQVEEDPASVFSGRVTGIGAKGAFVTLDGSRSAAWSGCASFPAEAGRSRPTGSPSSTPQGTAWATATPSRCRSCRRTRSPGSWS
jgi:ribonuclease R